MLLLSLIGLFAQDAKPIVIDSGIAIGGVARGGRVPFPTDALLAQLVTGQMKAPLAGDKLGNATWADVKANKDGWFEGRQFQGGYCLSSLDSARAQPGILNVAGDSLVYVNGELRTGDPYAFGYVQIPIMLKQGTNRFLFVGSRGRMHAELDPPKAWAQFNTADMTLPDQLLGSKDKLVGGMIVLNSADRSVKGLTIRTTAGGHDRVTKVPQMMGSSLRKVPFEIPPSEGNRDYWVTAELKDGETVLDSTRFTVRVRKPEQTRKETFFSKIDGSLQYYAVYPPPHPKPGMAMVLTLHGAGVEAIGQADAYSAKDWAYIVAATNRRPYGFDWEDWGRMDALEVLSIASKKYHTDPDRTYLAGHSMGGHGTWNVGVLFPNLFAAIAPSAGWRSFYSYAGKPRIDGPTTVEEMLERASATSDTTAMLDNFYSEGVYILHGDADDNVPVTEARAMRDLLKPNHPNFGYHEQPGAGHWWDGNAAPGADCVDWPGIFEMFEKTRESKPTQFVTYNPAVSDGYKQVAILEQIAPLTKSEFELKEESGTARIRTANVQAMCLNLNEGKVIVDGSVIPGPVKDCVVERERGSWFVTSQKASDVRRSGPFKEAFKNQMVFVYGTKGNPDENTWARNKARYDAETFWYRGNGSVDVVSDRDYLFGKYKGRNVVLYGNSDTNAAWGDLLSESPVQVKRGQATVGKRVIAGDDVCALFMHRKGTILIAAFAGTGLPADRTLDRAPVFVSGVGYPDWTIYRTSILTKGNAGVMGTGFFGPGGGLEGGQDSWAND